MADPKLIKQQLKRIGADGSLFCRPERRELPRILFDNEQIFHLINGQYSGGFAILCTTDQRILLVDKKPFYLTIEDIRYDMISDVMFNNRLINSGLVVGTIHKSIEFVSFNHAKIRALTSYVQQKVLEVRSSQQIASQNLLADQPVGAFGSPIMPNKNPYSKMPVVMSKRVSKYY